MNDDTLASYLGNFVHGFEDATQRRHLRKRGWIRYSRPVWHLTKDGVAEAKARRFLTAVADLSAPDQK